MQEIPHQGPMHVWRQHCHWYIFFSHNKIPRFHSCHFIKPIIYLLHHYSKIFASYTPEKLDPAIFNMSAQNLLSESRSISTCLFSSFRRDSYLLTEHMIMEWVINASKYDLPMHDYITNIFISPIISLIISFICETIKMATIPTGWCHLDNMILSLR